jgi:hypothetical protein
LSVSSGWVNKQTFKFCLGVGPMTVAMLMQNTVESAKKMILKQKVSQNLKMGYSLQPLFKLLRYALRK